MSDKFIPIQALRATPHVPFTLSAPDGILRDTLQRPLRDLRISVTDRCNFRCVYCMPKEVFDKDYAFLPQSALLNFEEITRLARIFVAHGVQKIRLTGGEPLLRKNLETLIGMLAEIKTPDGQALDLTLTTNGSLLARKAQALKDAGLTRVTVSLDSLDDAVFKQMNDVDYPVSDVLNGIDAAHDAGLPVKVNMVVKAGVNDGEIVPMASYFKARPHTLRFIEYMDVGASNGWKMDEVIPSAEIVRRIQDAGMPLVAIASNYAGETAARWRYLDGSGEIGLISSVSNAFCGDCTRLRLSTEGQLYTCLFASHGHDLRSLLRDHTHQYSDMHIANAIAHIWQQRSDRYSAARRENTTSATPSSVRKIEMSYIGG
jgi:GTP 3',8-cyclase